MVALGRSRFACQLPLNLPTPGKPHQWGFRRAPKKHVLHFCKSTSDPLPSCFRLDKLGFHVSPVHEERLKVINNKLSMQLKANSNFDLSVSKPCNLRATETSCIALRRQTLLEEYRWGGTSTEELHRRLSLNACVVVLSLAFSWHIAKITAGWVEYPGQSSDGTHPDAQETLLPPLRTPSCHMTRAKMWNSEDHPR